MKKIKLGSLITLFALTLFIFGCGETSNSNDDNGEQTEEATSENGENGENAEETASTDAENAEVDKTGKEYTSAFVCKMHCKGSGSGTAGSCPVCGMNYIASADLGSADDDGAGDDNGDDNGDDDKDQEGHDH